VLAKELYGLRERTLSEVEASFLPFTAQTRMSGVDVNGTQIRKGAPDAVRRFVEQNGGRYPQEIVDAVQRIAEQGGTPLVVARDNFALGTVHLKDIVKGGMHEQFDELRKMGIRTVMITGDNPVTPAVIAQGPASTTSSRRRRPRRRCSSSRTSRARGAWSP
jgi:potassium-transporting ATPase ATP-binding subunit